MSRYIVRVPLTGHIDVEVDANSEKTALARARDIADWIGHKVHATANQGVVTEHVIRLYAARIAADVVAVDGQPTLNSLIGTKS